MIRSTFRFLVRLVQWCLAFCVLVGLGIVVGLSIMAVPEVRHMMKLSPDAPNPVGEILDPSLEPEGPTITPLDKMGSMKGPNPFKRASWEGVEHETRPDDPRTDPRRGTTEIMFFHTALEEKLSSDLRQALLPNKILKVGIWSQALHHRTQARTAAQDSGRHDTSYWICYIEVYSGDPISRPAIEETVDRSIQIVFSTIPRVDSVDIVAVPWRTVLGHKPPTYFSVTAERKTYVGIAGARSHMVNLRSCGAVWCDARVMSNFPR